MNDRSTAQDGDLQAQATAQQSSDKLLSNMNGASVLDGDPLARVPQHTSDAPHLSHRLAPDTPDAPVTPFGSAGEAGGAGVPGAPDGTGVSGARGETGVTGAPSETGAPGVSGDAGATGVANAAQQIAEAAALSEGERPHRGAWRLARALYRAGNTDPADIEAVAEHWWNCSDPASRRPAIEDAITEVHEAMMKLDDPETNDTGKEGLARAFERSADRPIPVTIERYGKRNRVPASLYRLLLELTEASSVGTAWLAQGEAALLLGVRPQTVSYWMRRLVKDGVVELVKQGQRGEAATYRILEQGDDEPW